jgi:hypothetical protein
MMHRGGLPKLQVTQASLKVNISAFNQTTNKQGVWRNGIAECNTTPKFVTFSAGSAVKSSDPSRRAFLKEALRK